MDSLIQIGSSEKPFPVYLTEAALSKAIDARREDPDLSNLHKLRVGCKGGGCSGYYFSLDFDDRVIEGDVEKQFLLDSESLTVVIDPKSAPLLTGLTVDYVKAGLTEGFKFVGGNNIKRTCGCGASFSV